VTRSQILGYADKAIREWRRWCRRAIGTSRVGIYQMSVDGADHRE